MDSQWKIWTTFHQWKNVDPERIYILLAKFGSVVSEVPGNYSGPSVHQHAIQCSLIPGHTQESLSAYTVQSLQQMHVSNAAWGRWGLPVIHFSRYATVNSTNVLRSHWLSFVWLACSGNKFFRVGPGKFVSGGTNFRGVQIKHDNHTHAWEPDFRD